MTLGDLTAAKLVGRGRVELKFPAIRVLTLHRVRYVSSIRRNILSDPVLMIEGFQLDCKCNKVATSHLSSDCFYGKGYFYGIENLFKLRMEHNNSVTVNVSSSHSVVFCFESWHERLGHVNVNSLKRMINLNIIPKFVIDKKNKGEICV